MNDVNFNSPDPINNAPKSNLQMPVKPMHKNEENSVLKIFLIIFSIFLVILSFSIIYSLVSKTQGTGEIVTNEQVGTISVNASSTVYVTPDEASVSIGIETSGASMEEASLENDRKAENIINKVQVEGVLKENIKIIEYSIEPQYQKQTIGVDLKQYPEGKIIISSYKIKEVIQIKMPVEKVEVVIKTALEASATTISDLKFEVKDRESYVESARVDAVNKAREKAESIAQSLNVKLSNPVNYSDNDYDSIYGGGGAGSLAITDVISKNEITINTYITYSIKK